MVESLELSVVVPAYNEAGNAAALAREIADALDGRAYEIIFVDDGSSDGTMDELSALKEKLSTLRIVRHRRNAGQSRAVRTGVEHARAPVIATLDGDGQNDPADLPALYRTLTRAGAPENLGLVMGERARHRDTAWKSFGSRIGNSVRRRLLRDASWDSGCGAKAFYKSVFDALPYFDHMHRYMPALVQAEGWRVEFEPVSHRARRAGRSKYTNFGRLQAAVRDLRGVMWLARRRRPHGGADEI